jgi:hypothetical protein
MKREVIMNFNGSSRSRSLSKSLGLTFAAVALTASLSACTSFQTVNEHLFDEPEKLAQLQDLKEGTSSQKILDILGVEDPEKVLTVSNEIQTIRNALYGGDIQVQATPDQLEDFRQRLKDYEVWVLPYTKVEKNWRISGTSYDTRKDGMQNKMVFVINRKTGKLAEDVQLTNSVVKSKDKEAIIPSMLKGAVKKISL